MSHSDAEEGEILKASSPGADQISVGMDVIGVDGQAVGRVKEVRSSDFLLDRPLDRALYVPYQFVLSVPERGEKPVRPVRVILTVSGEQLDTQEWERA